MPVETPSRVRLLSVLVMAAVVGLTTASCAGGGATTPVPAVDNSTAQAPAEPDTDEATTSASTGDGAWTGSEYFASEDEAMEAMLGPRICELLDQPNTQRTVLEAPLEFGMAEVTKAGGGSTCKLPIKHPTDTGNYGFIYIRSLDGTAGAGGEPGLMIDGHECVQSSGETFGNADLSAGERCSVGAREIYVSFSELIAVSEQRDDGMRSSVQAIMYQILVRLDRNEADLLHSSTPP